MSLPNSFPLLPLKHVTLYKNDVAFLQRAAPLAEASRERDKGIVRSVLRIC